MNTAHVSIRQSATPCLLFAVLLFLLTGCDDCPDCPSEEDVDRPYLAATCGLTEDTVTTINFYETARRQFCDSLPISGVRGVKDISLSADGTRLLIIYETESPGGGWEYQFRFAVFDIASKAKICSLMVKVFDIEVSNTGQYVALYGYDSLFLLDGHTYEVISASAKGVTDCRFLSDDTRLYAIDGSNRVYIYDPPVLTEADTIEYRDNDGISPALYDIQPNLDGSKLYFFCRYNAYYGSLSGYIVALDSTTLHYPIPKVGPGDLRLTPDGRQIIATDPGYMAVEDFGTGDVIFADTRTDAVIAIVPAAYSIGGQIPRGFYAGEVSVTPDSRYTLVASCGLWVFGMIDNSLHRFVDIHLFSRGEVSFLYLSCQKY